MALVTLNFSIRDGKGKESTVELYTSDGFTLAQLVGTATALVPLIRNVVSGGVTGANITISVDLSGLLGSFPTLDDPAPDSDVEEGALFLFNTITGFPKRNRFPTFDETLISPGSRDVDITDARVIPLVNAIVNGITSGGTTVTFNDSREDDITQLNEAYESFQSSRNRAR